MSTRTKASLVLGAAVLTAALVAGSQHVTSQPTRTVVIDAAPSARITAKSAKKTPLRPQETPAPCPSATFPTSPSDQTSYAVPFQASILDGYLNAGYHEVGATTPFGPWGLHLANLTGTVCGLLQIPSLQLSVQGVNVSINQDGQINPIDPNTDQPAPTNGPTSLTSGASATYTFNGLADPANQVGGGAAGIVINMDSVSTDTVGEATYRVDDPAPLASPMTIKAVTIKGKSAIAFPGVTVAPGATPVSGTITVESTVALTNVTASESEGFVTGASTLSPGTPQSYTFSFIPNSNGEGTVPVQFEAESASGKVGALAVAYYQNSKQGLSISNVVINPSGPLQSGTEFSGSFSLKNVSSGTISQITGTTNQAASLYIMGGSPSGPAPTSLTGFNLSVVSQDLSTGVTGVLSNGALSAAATANTVGTFFAADPLLECEAPVVNAGLTTGSSTVQPVGRGSSSIWAMQGQGVEGPLIGADATLVGNDFPLTIADTSGCPTIYQDLFNEIIGGYSAAGSYYNGTIFDEHGSAPAGEVQLVLNVEVTSVDLPSADPTAASSAELGRA